MSKVSVLYIILLTTFPVKALILITTLEESYQTAHKTEIHFSFESQNMSFFNSYRVAKILNRPSNHPFVAINIFSQFNAFNFSSKATMSS
jgi:hypothetical protein